MSKINTTRIRWVLLQILRGEKKPKGRTNAALRWLKQEYGPDSDMGQEISHIMKRGFDSPAKALEVASLHATVVLKIHQSEDIATQALGVYRGVCRSEGMGTACGGLARPARHSAGDGGHRNDPGTVVQYMMYGQWAIREVWKQPRTEPEVRKMLDGRLGNLKAPELPEYLKYVRKVAELGEGLWTRG